MVEFMTVQAATFFDASRILSGNGSVRTLPLFFFQISNFIVAFRYDVWLTNSRLNSFSLLILPLDLLPFCSQISGYGRSGEWKAESGSAECYKPAWPLKEFGRTQESSGFERFSEFHLFGHMARVMDDGQIHLWCFQRTVGEIWNSY